jgi:hypothetical protein
MKTKWSKEANTNGYDRWYGDNPASDNLQDILLYKTTTSGYGVRSNTIRKFNGQPFEKEFKKKSTALKYIKLYMRTH